MILRHLSNHFMILTIRLFIVIRNGKIVWKHGRYCKYFRLNLKFLVWSYRECIKTAKMAAFSEDFLSGDDFEVFCCWSVMRQKGESQNGCFSVCVSGGKKCLSFGNFGVLCFLETPVLRFALLPYSRRVITMVQTLLRQLKCSLQMKKMITNAVFCLFCFAA